MKVKHRFLLFFAASWLFFSCETKTICDSCNTSKFDYSTGVFVVNEGPWGGTGTISWYNPATGEVRDSIFEKANNGAVLGQFVQSLAFHNGKGYIVVNGANRIVVVNAVTFEYLDTIGGLALPRYFLPVNEDIAYVSQWGLDGVSGSVAKIDLNTNEVIKVIPTGSGPEKMTFSLDNQQIIIPNSGGYGTDSSFVSFFTNNDDLVVKTIIPGQRNPCCFNPGAVIAATPPQMLCKGDWTDASSQGWVGQPYAPFVGFAIPKGSDDLVFYQGSYYFSSGTAVYSLFANSLVKNFDQPSYGLAIHPTTGQLYCADAKDFNSAGEVVIRKPNGALVGSFRTGIAPGEIVFVE